MGFCDFIAWWPTAAASLYIGWSGFLYNPTVNYQVFVPRPWFDWVIGFFFVVIGVFAFLFPLIFGGLELREEENRGRS